MELSVKGYAWKMNEGSTEKKAAKFIVTESDHGIEFLSIDPYQGLPCYSPLILYDLVLTKDNKSPLYCVKRINKCSKKYEKGIPKAFLEEFFRGSRDIYQLHQLPKKIKKKKELKSKNWYKGFLDLVSDVTDPYFRGESFYDLLRYTPSSFLLRFSDAELDYLMSALETVPYLFCFRETLKRYCCTPVTDTDGKILFSEDKRRNKPKRGSGNSASRFTPHEKTRLFTGYTYAYEKRKYLTQSMIILYDATVPLWCFEAYRYYCKDHDIEANEIIKACMHCYLTCEFIRDRLGVTAFEPKTVIPAENGERVQSFLLETGLFALESFAINKRLCYPEVEIEQLNYMRWFLTNKARISVESIDGRISTAMKAISQIAEGYFVICPSAIMSSMLTKRYNMNACIAASFAEGDVEKNDCKNIAFVMPHELDISTFNRCIEKWKPASGDYSVKLIGSKRGRVKGSHDYFFTTSRFSASTNNVRDTMEEDADNNGWFHCVRDKNIGSINKEIYDTVPAVISSFSKTCAHKVNKNKTRYTVCSSEKKRNELFTEHMDKCNIIYSNDILYLNRRVRIRELGFDGILVDASKLCTSSGKWIKVEQKDLPLYVRGIPHMITVYNQEAETSITVQTDHYSCFPSEFELVSDVPFSAVDSVAFFVDASTTYDEVMKMATMYKADFTLYVERGLDLGVIFDKPSKIGNSALQTKMSHFCKDIVKQQ
jgi:hypothetical protein